MGALVARPDSLGYLRDGLTADPATDLVFALFSRETFLALTRDAQWTIGETKPGYKRRCAGSSLGRPAPVLRSLSFEAHVS